MSDERVRDEGGRYTEKITDQAILKVFDAAGEPFLTTSDVHEALDVDVSQKAVYHRLNRMHEHGTVGKKSTGARAVGWWAKKAPKLSPEATERVRESEDAFEAGDAVALEDAD